MKTTAIKIIKNKDTEYRMIKRRQEENQSFLEAKRLFDAQNDYAAQELAKIGIIV